eukprot:1671783-Pyramimonas_sp.AAC.1
MAPRTELDIANFVVLTSCVNVLHCNVPCTEGTSAPRALSAVCFVARATLVHYLVLPHDRNITYMRLLLLQYHILLLAHATFI